MKNEFQYRLQKALAEKRISASELSRLSGVNKVAISNYINGVYVAKQDKCYLLAKALDVDPGWLMTGDEPVSTKETLVNAFQEYYDEHGIPIAEMPKTPEARIISGGIDKMPPERREQALKILQLAFSEYADYFKEEPTDET